MKLSRAQWSAVRYDGNTLVLSVPGAGKTRIVQAKTIQEAAKLIDSPLRVACLTYTTAAAAELRRRILPSLREDAREAVLIGTLHSFSIQEILAPHAARLEELGHGFAVATPEHPEAEFVLENLLGREPTGDELRWFGEVSRSADGSAKRHDNLEQGLIEQYWKSLLGRGLIDFSGVMYYAAVLLERYADVARAVAASFSWFIVDEYQDTSTSQIRVLRSISSSGKAKWLLIGDYNQSIFSFNGVSKPELVEFSQSIGAKQGTLSRTYRCPPAIVEHANRLIGLPKMQAASQLPHGSVFLVQGSYIHCVREYIQVLANHHIPIGEAAIIAPFRWMLSDAQKALSGLPVPIVWSPQFRFAGKTDVSDCLCAIFAYALHDDVEHYLTALAAMQRLFDSVGFKITEADLALLVLRLTRTVNTESLESYSFCSGVDLLSNAICGVVPGAIRVRFIETCSARAPPLTSPRVTSAAMAWIRIGTHPLPTSSRDSCDDPWREGFGICCSAFLRVRKGLHSLQPCRGLR